MWLMPLKLQLCYCVTVTYNWKQMALIRPTLSFFHPHYGAFQAPLFWCGCDMSVLTQFILQWSSMIVTRVVERRYVVQLQQK